MANSGDINTSITNRQKINAGIKETLLKGASAYELAVQEGYVGTEEEWLASLHGTDGHTPELSSERTGSKETTLYADGEAFARILDGIDGADGRDGQNGQDGHSPEITATKSGKTVSIKVDGTEVATVSDGNDGSPGATGPSGADGHTPQITATKSGKVTTIKADGTTIAEINDGNDGATGATGPQGPKGDPGALNFHICSQTEYDATTRVPTVQNPEDDTFYLVPSASVTSPDLFVEWIYVNNAWEMFGSATVDISEKADKVINATSGNFASLDSNGNLVDSGHKHSDYLTQHQDISGKADKVQNATSGNFAGLDSNGNLTDSGHSFTEINQELTSVKSDLSQKYEKPSGGIPDSDLSSGVQTSLGKADTAYQKPSTGIPASDLASGIIPEVPVQDVQIGGTSVLGQDGVANIPKANEGVFGVVKINPNNGITVSSDGLSIVRPSDSTLKGGNDNYKVLTPYLQHISTFYGLAKVAGDTTQSQSSNAAGTYTDDAKIKIQKMLGIYEAPWELIREDTFTNATEADYEITVDGNGDAFELTDVVIMFETPTQDVQSKFQNGGGIRFYHNYTGTSNSFKVECGAWTQNANALSRGCFAMVMQNGNMLEVSRVSSVETPNTGSTGMRYGSGLKDIANTERLAFGLLTTPFYINKININAVTGTGHYKLYGRRKWT